MKQLSISQKDSSNGFEIQKQLKSTKYNEVRDKLDKLKYKFHFDISNLQLIDLLTNDISNLQADLDNFKKENQNLKASNERTNLSLNAFKQENIKLIKDNNELIKQNVEFGKNLYTSNSSKQMEIKRLQEELKNGKNKTHNGNFYIFILDEKQKLILSDKEKSEIFKNEFEKLKISEGNYYFTYINIISREKDLRGLY